MTYSTVPFFPRPISRIVIGSMAFSYDDMERCVATLDEYVRLGGNAIDTASVYGAGRYKAIGEYLRLRGRDKLILMDKGCHPSDRKRVTKADMAADILSNQEHMGLDHTEFFVLHRDDPDVPVEQIVDWLNENKEAGRISAFGGSNWQRSRLTAANAYAASHRLQGFSLSSPNVALAVANEPMWAGAYSLTPADRRWYEQTQFPLFSWSSGSGGFFAGVNSDDVKRVYHSEENFRRKARAEEIGRKHGVAATPIAVAWTLCQPLAIHAIVGPRNPKEVADNLGVVDLKLSREELEYLEKG